jgi:hypothetical protein
MRLLRRFWSTDRSLSLLLASLVLVIFVIQPLQVAGVGSRVLIGVFFSFMLISGVGAVAKNALTTAVVGGLVVTSLAMRWLRLWLGGESLVISDTAISSLFCIILAVVVLAQVFREGPVTWYRIQGAVAFYLLLGLAWAGAYELIELRLPNAFVLQSSATMNQNDDPTTRFVYFSFVTLTTVGYGDVTAAHPLARSLVTLEALIGQLFPAILLARLVSMEVYHRQANDRNALRKDGHV